jgi:hypothetical protein
MATYVLIHGAGDSGWYWHLLEAELRARGHDVVVPDLTAEALRRGRDQSATPGAQPWPLPSWPDVPTRFLLCRDDRFFPADFLRHVVQERLAITPDEIDGQPLRRPQPPPRPGRPPGVVPGRAVGPVARAGCGAPHSAPGRSRNPAGAAPRRSTGTRRGAGGHRHPAVPTRRPLPARPCRQLHPLVVPQDSQTKHDPAGRIRTPQVEQ